MRRLLSCRQYGGAATLMSTSLRLAGFGETPPGLTAGAPGPAGQPSDAQQPLPPPQQEGLQQPQAEQRARQREPDQQQKQPQDLFGLLLEATGQPAAAAGGLTAELAASYAALLPQLPLDEKKEKARLHARTWLLLACLVIECMSAKRQNNDVGGATPHLHSPAALQEDFLRRLLGGRHYGATATLIRLALQVGGLPLPPAAV